MRCWMTASWYLSSDWNNGPHTGMSDDPWDAGPLPNLRMPATVLAGYLPSCFLLSWDKSVGGTFIAVAAGPFPFPSVPWQEAQYWLNISLPDAALVSLMTVFLMTGLVSELFCARQIVDAASNVPSKIMPFFNMMSSSQSGIDCGERASLPTLRPQLER